MPKANDWLQPTPSDGYQSGYEDGLQVALSIVLRAADQKRPTPDVLMKIVADLETARNQQ